MDKISYKKNIKSYVQSERRLLAALNHPYGSNKSSTQIPKEDKLGPNFYEKLVAMTSKIGMKPEDLLAVMLTESAFDPAARNPYSNASGLIQFMPSTLSSVGWHGTPEQFRELSGAEQLDYIEKYINNVMKVNKGQSFSSAHQYYIANLWPVGLLLSGVRQNNPETAFLESNPEPTQETNSNGEPWSKKYFDVGVKILVKTEKKAYQANNGFDKAKKGSITVGDMMAHMERNKQDPRYLAMIEEMKRSINQPSLIDNTPKAISSIMPNNSSIIPVLEEHSPNSNLPSGGVLLPVYDMPTSDNITASSKKYLKYLPKNRINIKISSNNTEDALEYSRILCTALDDELQSKSYIHASNNIVEIDCIIHGPSKSCLSAVQEVSKQVSDEFRIATKKIGGIKISTHIAIGKSPIAPLINLKTAEINYRKFLLKFI